MLTKIPPPIPQVETLCNMALDGDDDWAEADRLTKNAALESEHHASSSPSSASASLTRSEYQSLTRADLPRCAEGPVVLHITAAAFVLIDSRHGSMRGGVSIDRRTGEVRAAQPGRPTGAVEMGIAAVMGVLHLDRESFLVVVSQATQAATMCGGAIFSVTEAHLFPFALLPAEKKSLPAQPVIRPYI